MVSEQFTGSTEESGRIVPVDRPVVAPSGRWVPEDRLWRLCADSCFECGCHIPGDRHSPQRLMAALPGLHAGDNLAG